MTNCVSNARNVIWNHYRYRYREFVFNEQVKENDSKLNKML